MPTFPIYTCRRLIVGRDGELSWDHEVASFDPIPRRYEDGPAFSLWQYTGCSEPTHWIKAPALSRLGPSSDGSPVLFLPGEDLSARAAWVVLALARRGEAGYRLADPPAATTTPATPVPPRNTVAFDVYSAPQRVYFRGREVNAWEVMAFAPIAGSARDLGDGFERVQEPAIAPAYRVLAPASAELVGRMVVRLAPCAPPPYRSPEQLVRNAAAGRLGLELAEGSATPGPLRLPPKVAGTIHKPDGLVVEDLSGQGVFSWAC